MPGHFLDWLDAADPSRIALVDDERAVTYGQLRDEAQVVASGLTRRFGTGRFLLLPAERTVGFVRLLCALLLCPAPHPLPAIVLPPPTGRTLHPRQCR